MLDEDLVMGACVYEMDDRKKQAYIYTAAVDKFYRNEGVYTTIYKEVERVCRMNGMKVLNSNIHVNNDVMIEHALRNDRELLWFRTRKVL